MLSSFRQLFSENSLTARVFRGGVWLAAGNALTRLIGVLRVIVLGRLLTPSDFGVVTMAMVAFQWIEYFGQTGIQTALIQKQGDARPYLRTAWTIDVFRGLTLTLLAIAAAPLAGHFFNNPQVVPMLQVTGIIAAIRGFQSPAAVCLRRDLNFRREVLWRLTGTITNLVTVVPLAVYFRSGWAIIVAVVCSHAVETAFSYWAQPFKPRLEFDKKRARELLRFGRWIVWNNLLIFPSRFLDTIVVGKFLGARLLGFYQVASQLAMLPTAQTGIFLGGLMLPAFTKLEQRSDLRRAFLRVLSLVVSFMLPVACFVTVFAGPVIRILLGAQWLQSAPLAKILVWAGVATALTEITGQMLIRQGKPQLATWSNLVKTLLLAGIFYPLLQAMHNEGIALALFAGSVVGLCIQLRYICLLLNARWREIGRTTIAGAVASLPFVAVRVVGDPAVMAYPVQAATGLASLATCAAVLLAFRGRIAAA